LSRRDRKHSDPTPSWFGYYFPNGFAHVAVAKHNTFVYSCQRHITLGLQKCFLHAMHDNATQLKLDQYLPLTVTDYDVGMFAAAVSQPRPDPNLEVRKRG